MCANAQASRAACDGACSVDPTETCEDRRNITARKPFYQKNRCNSDMQREARVLPHMQW